MARKSRKNMMPQAAVQEAVQQNEKELLRTAAYARLSVENGGHPCHPQHQDGRARTAGSAGQHSGGQCDVPDRCKQRFGRSINGGSD